MQELERARDLVHSGQLQAAADIFGAIVSGDPNPRNRYIASSGLGHCLAGLGHPQDGDECLRHSYTIASGLGDSQLQIRALHDLASLAKAQGDDNAAKQYSEMATAVTADCGIIERLLASEDTEAARTSLRLMRQLRFSRSPIPAAFVGYVLHRMLLALPLGAAIGWPLGLWLVALSNHRDQISLGIAIGILLTIIGVAIFQRIVIETTKYELNDGLFIVTRGVFTRKVIMTEAFRVHNFKVHQNLFDRWYGTGSIVVVGEKETNQPTLALRGIGEGDSLRPLVMQFRELNRALRATVLFKGIVRS